jgi:ribonuclease HI
MVELESTAYSYYKLARAELEACNPRAGYAAALRAVAAARRERSFYVLFSASDYAIECVQHGALGLTWRWSQVEPFLDNMEEALPHLKRWMPPARLQRWIEGYVAPLHEWRRLFAHSDR